VADLYLVLTGITIGCGVVGAGLIFASKSEINIAVRQDSRSSTRLTKELEQLLYVQNRRMTEDLTERLTSALRVSLPSTRTDASTDVLKIVRELSHSLGNPLAGIKADASTLRHEDLSGGSTESVERIRVGVDLCQTFLLAYRNIGIIDHGTGFLAQSSLQDLVVKAIQFYAARTTIELKTEVALPDSIPPFSNYQVLAALLPLLENAVEASTDGQVVVQSTIGSERPYIQVENVVASSPPADMMEDGVTSKDPSEHSGLGLGISQRMALSLGWKLSANCSDHHFVAKLDIEGQRS
jgi:signal transduction histidine kinase